MQETALIPPRRRRRWHDPGLTPRQETAFHWIAAVLVIAMMSAWIWSAWLGAHEHGEPETVSGPPPPPVRVARSVSDSLVNPSAPSTAYINDAMLEFLSPLRGYSGKVNVAVRTPGSEITSTEESRKDPEVNPAMAARLENEKGEVLVSSDFTAPDKPGIYRLAVQIDQAKRAIDDLNVITLVPFTNKRNNRIGLYYLGQWPYERGGKPRSKAYANPAGFIEVTPQNKSLYVSEHFQLQDFLTKGQNDVWPKYLLLDPKLLDKLELIADDLNEHGYHVEHITVMSGFRTPSYNYTGGNTKGRANLSRHMYGDASDIFVDNDRDHWTDDLDGDGKVNLNDAEIMAAAADRVERKYPSLVGGVGTYVACCGHGPFVHVDVRGYRARWRGTGNG